MNDAVQAETSLETSVETPTNETSAEAPREASREASKPTGKMYTVKYPDGREEQHDEAWMKERAQKSIGLEKRVSDASRYETAFNNFVAKVQDPTQLLELLNHPDLKYDEEKQESLVKAMLSSKKPRIIEAVKRWIYDNEIVPSMMDPKEREAMEWKQKAEALESDKLKKEKELRDEQEERNVAQIKEAYRIKLGEAYQKSGLPQEEFLVRQVMEKARLYVKAGKHPDFENCVKLVNQDFISLVKNVLGKATVDNILNLMDGETPKVINKALMKALENGKDSPIEADPDRTPRKRKEKERTPEEKKRWLRNLERGIVD